MHPQWAKVAQGKINRTDLRTQNNYIFFINVKWVYKKERGKNTKNCALNVQWLISFTIYQETVKDKAVLECDWEK